MTYCTNCKKDVTTGWKFGREHCRICDTPLTEQIKIGVIPGLFDRIENNRKAVESMVSEGMFSKNDFR